MAGCSPVAASSSAASNYVAVDCTNAAARLRDSNWPGVRRISRVSLRRLVSPAVAAADSHLNLPDDCWIGLQLVLPSNFLSCAHRVRSAVGGRSEVLRGNCCGELRTKALWGTAAIGRVSLRGPGSGITLRLPVRFCARAVVGAANQTAHCAYAIAACRSTVRAACSIHSGIALRTLLVSRTITVGIAR